MKKLHISVMPEETISALNINPCGVYIDCTFGAGGHSNLILEKLNTNGQLIAFDQDLKAVKDSENIIKDQRFKIFHSNFNNLKVQILKHFSSEFLVDGIFFDLGVSSMQLDQADRGFSFMQDGPLDMRMNQNNTLLAKDVVNTFSEKKLADIFWNYGDEKASKKIAKAIIDYRVKKQFTTTLELAELCKKIIPMAEHKHSATRVFQALRIFVNNEISIIEDSLKQAFSLLKKDGTLAVLTFHSTEDKIVKNCFKKLTTKSQINPWPMPQVYKDAQAIFVEKMAKPKFIEIKENIRSRSAVLRGIKKC